MHFKSDERDIQKTGGDGALMIILKKLMNEENDNIRSMNETYAKIDREYKEYLKPHDDLRNIFLDKSFKNAYISYRNYIGDFGAERYVELIIDKYVSMNNIYIEHMVNMRKIIWEMVGAVKYLVHNILDFEKGISSTPRVYHELPIQTEFDNVRIVFDNIYAKYVK
jgi:hypothetical protein